MITNINACKPSLFHVWFPWSTHVSRFGFTYDHHDQRASSFHASLLQAIDGVMPLALCPQVVSWAPQHFRSSGMQATCDGCFARQSIWSVIFRDSGISWAVHPQGHSQFPRLGWIHTVQFLICFVVSIISARGPFFCFVFCFVFVSRSHHDKGEAEKHN